MNTAPQTLVLIFLIALVACAQKESPALPQPVRAAGAEAMLIASPDLQDKVKIAVLISAGESVPGGGYKMTGVGDGIGVYSERGKIIALMNHELKDGQGGAFVSRWVLDNATYQIASGEDLTREVFFYKKSLPAQAGMLGYEKLSEPMARLCSADLPAISALSYNVGYGEQARQLGTDERIFFSGEERIQGRAFAHFATGEYAGNSYELPAMGRMSFENIVLNPFPQRKTVAMLMDDATNHTYTTHWPDLSGVDRELVKRRPPSELYVYIGEKQPSGAHPLESAGLTFGRVYAVRVLDTACAEGDERCRNTPNAENREAWLGGDAPVRFELRKIEVPTNDADGHRFQVAAYQSGATQFLRLEDGAWDPRPGHANEYYFATTDEFNGNSRLFKLTFTDLLRPEAGGVIEIMINGNPGMGGREGPALVMMDNLTVDPWGRILIQEDPGNHPRLAKVWLYDIDTREIRELARHNPKYFETSDSDAYLTTNEESSGIVHAFDTLGEGWYLLNVQAHARHEDKEVVEHGQFLKMYVPRDL